MAHGRWSTVNATTSQKCSGRVVWCALAGFGLLCVSVGTALGESRGESYQPDGKAPRSSTQITHQVRTRSDGVQIRISVRQETEGREASSEQRETRDRRPIPATPESVPSSPPAALPADP